MEQNFKRLANILLDKFKLGFGFTVLFRSCSFLQDIIITNYLLSERIIRMFISWKITFWGERNIKQ